jgi:hypothetical protein
MKKRIFLHPCDGSLSIGARRLAELYKVNFEECYVVEKSEEVFHDGYPRGTSRQEGDIHLYPRYVGDYTHPGLMDQRLESQRLEKQ